MNTTATLIILAPSFLFGLLALYLYYTDKGRKKSEDKTTSNTLEIVRLTNLLNKAVEDERFEEASLLRSRIKKLRENT